MRNLIFIHVFSGILAQNLTSEISAQNLTSDFDTEIVNLTDESSGDFESFDDEDMVIERIDLYFEKNTIKIAENSKNEIKLISSTQILRHEYSKKI